MSPGQWLDHVERKQYEDIAVVQDVQGDIQYVRSIAQETQVRLGVHEYTCTEYMSTRVQST